jgi:CRISPR-associated protein Cas2
VVKKLSATHILLVYDIEEDRRRTKIADACLDYGLDRIQYSAFAGVLSRTHQEELMLKISHLLDETPGKIHLYEIDEKAWKRRLTIETYDDAEAEDGQALTAD